MVVNLVVIKKICVLHKNFTGNDKHCLTKPVHWLVGSHITGNGVCLCVLWSNSSLQATLKGQGYMQEMSVCRSTDNACIHTHSNTGRQGEKRQKHNLYQRKPNMSFKLQKHPTAFPWWLCSHQPFIPKEINVPVLLTRSSSSLFIFCV